MKVGVDETQDDTPEAARGFAEGLGVSGPTLYQPEPAEEYKVAASPTVCVPDGENRVVEAYSGGMPREVFESWMEEALG
ncbi:TlpA family protein disulfide reductase [Rubrobacter indicoceani]|uniref:TlpA family protein disulfide reductase n=1 Tax=Rubrobacter indicoceani TaxID=2051957 RepID=UPI000E5A1DBA|nr:hypothetical protein [Rubrobacter indicoceani]